MRKLLLLSASVLCASSAGASAVGFKTQMSCAGDYYAYCSQYSVGSPEVRKCMRAAGPKLSKGCINALIADGEVSAQEVARQKEKIAAAKAKPKVAEPKKADVAGLRKPEAETKKAAKISVAAAPQPVTAQAAKPKIAHAAEAATLPQKPVQAAPAISATRALALDQQTFEDLKARGTRFVANDDADADITSTADLARLPNAEAPAASEAEQAASGEGSQGWATTAEQEAPAAADQDQEVAAASDETPAPPIQYPPGRMSLGHKLPTAGEEEQTTSWWDELVRTFTGE